MCSPNAPVVQPITSNRQITADDHWVVNPMNARLLQTSKPSSLEIQTHRNVDPLLRKQIVKLEAAQIVEKIGGRDRVRTCDPPLAKQIGARNWRRLIIPARSRL